MVEGVLSVIGRSFAGAVLLAMLGGDTRFSEIRRSVVGVADSVLTTRLKELCAAGLAVRAVDPGPPVTVTYSLTEAGLDLAPVLHAIAAFSRRYPEVGATSTD